MTARDAPHTCTSEPESLAPPAREPVPCLANPLLQSPESKPLTRTQHRFLEQSKRQYPFWLVLLPLAIYALALNPHFLPATYDNIVYYFGGVSLADHGSFQFREKFISDWQPGFSALLALPFRLAGPSVWMAKICVLLSAAGGLILALRLFQNERRDSPVLSLCLFALLPVSFAMGVCIMSEWPYFLASMLFLHALHYLRAPVSDRASLLRRLSPAVGTGLLLGLASLTKVTGVLLGAAVVAQMAEKFVRSKKGRGFQAVLPELVTALLGGGLFLIWKAKIQWQIHAGTALPYEYYRSGWIPEHLNQFAPLNVPGIITDLFCHSKPVLTGLGWTGWTAGLACAVPGLLVLIGLLARLFSSERCPSDWYVVALIGLFSFVGTNQQTRYLMPVGPFLISYGFHGCRQIGRWLRLPAQWHQSWAARLALGAWFLLLTASAFRVVFLGDFSSTHNALFYFLSRTPEQFYRGSWSDRYQACQAVKNDPTPGSVAVIGGDDKYVTAFTGRRWLEFDPAKEFAFLLVLDRGELPQTLDALNLTCVRRFPSLVLYKRGGTHELDVNR
jgi:hypothetical protein